MTAEPSGSRATRENRKMAASKELKNVRAPAKKKFPAHAQSIGPRYSRMQARLVQLSTAYESPVKQIKMRLWDAMAGMTAKLSGRRSPRNCDRWRSEQS